MTAPPGHDSPYPAAPPPADDPPQWFKWLWKAVSRIALFAAGTVLVFLPDGSDMQVTAGAALMLGSAGVAIAQGVK